MNRLQRTVLAVMFVLFAVETLPSEDCLPVIRRRVYIIRGFSGYWPCVNDMAERVRRKNYNPSVFYSWQMIYEKDRIVERYRSGKEHGPVLIIGYSMGAEAAALLAHGLGEQGIRVKRLLLIEPFDYPQIPENVDYCFNLYQPRLFDRVQPFRGTSVGDVCASTRLWEINVATDPEYSDLLGDVNHFQIADHEFVQDLVVSQLP